MTTPRKQDIDNADSLVKQFPTNMPGLIYALVQMFGAWALIAVGTVVLWVQYKDVNSQMMMMLQANITASHASTKAITDLASEIKTDRENAVENLDSMDEAIRAMMETLRQNQTLLKDSGTVLKDNNNALHELKSTIDSRNQ